MKIRTATKNDLNTIVSFNLALAQESEGLTLNSRLVQRGVEAVFADPTKGFYLLATENEEIVGQLLITKEWSDWRNGYYWWIQSVYVKPEYRQRGVYRFLHQYVRKLAKEEGNVCGIRLYVEQENQAAQNVYKKVGMKPSRYRIFEEE
ncbi:MAG: GNAT family N-acetyltransferase [Fidelibacterota bacterium]